MNQEGFLKIAVESDLAKVKPWLSSRKINTYSTGMKDKNNFPLIGLGYDRRPDSDWSKPDKMGLIWCKNDDLLVKAEDLVRSHLGLLPILEELEAE